MKTLIKNALIVNEGKRFNGCIVIDGETISQITETTNQLPQADRVIDAKGCIVMPGVIDEHVHFRDPGLTHKADVFTESVAAVAGGVTSVMDMPNVVPQTTTIELLEQRFANAAEKSVANYSFYIGATNDNIDQIRNIDTKRVCGVKVFMGSSTGNMLVSDQQMLERVFSESPRLVATHCEVEQIIKDNLAKYSALYGDKLNATHHSLIRSEEACVRSTEMAMQLAQRCGTRLHVMHISTAKEAELFSSASRFEKKITGETCINYLYFNDADYQTLGYRIKCNPAIKTKQDQMALIKAVADGRLDTIATDHAPHLPAEKFGDSYKTSASGVPMVQHSLVAMIDLCNQGLLTFEQVVDRMCHAPADIYGIEKRGYLRPDYKADIVIVDPNKNQVIDQSNILYKCGWSPLEGKTISATVTHTFVNGNLVYSNGEVNAAIKGQELRFA